MKNAYPEKPEIQYRKTAVEMPDVVQYIKSLSVSKEIKIAAYVMFRMESGNGKKGVNNNYAGIQADGSRWPEKYDNYIVATCVLNENKTGKKRRFVCFDSWKSSVDMLVDRVQSRGLHVGGYAHLVAKLNVTTPEEWVLAYYMDWVTGKAKAVPDSAYSNSLLSIYKQGQSIF